ncbi:MAG: hypothetical protein LBS77_06140 [Desulfovibrio sp.]|nr:hypothetical protein [Desulfovibrio sp.]
MLTKNTVCNLINRYKAVLGKCRLAQHLRDIGRCGHADALRSRDRTC